MAISVINRCPEISPQTKGSQTSRMTHKASPMEGSLENVEEYHIDKDVGFALPNPLVREGTEL